MLVSALVLLLVLVSPSLQYVSIELENGSKSLGHNYEDNSLFTYNYAGFDGQLSGYVWQWTTGFPNNGCEYIVPLPYSVKPSLNKWFAMINDIDSCKEKMIKNVRNAGFDLVIGYSNGSSGTSSVPRSLRDDEFPILSITGDYADKLLKKAVTNNPAEAILVEIKVENYDVLLVGMCAGFFVSMVTCSIALLCVIYCKCRSRRGQYSFVRDMNHNDPLRQRYAQARLARQELIESILRQLQEFQEGEDGHHPPLGEERTRALPQMTFAEACQEGMTEEKCAICVEEFEVTDNTRVLPCKHYFHPLCIDPWLIEHSSMCPLCKQSVSQPPREEDGTRQFEHEQRASETSEVDSNDFSTPVAIISPMHPQPAVMQDQTMNYESSSTSSDAPLLSSCPSLNNV